MSSYGRQAGRHSVRTASEVGLQNWDVGRSLIDPHDTHTSTQPRGERGGDRRGRRHHFRHPCDQELPVANVASSQSPMSHHRSGLRMACPLPVRHTMSHHPV